MIRVGLHLIFLWENNLFGCFVQLRRDLSRKSVAVKWQEIAGRTITQREMDATSRRGSVASRGQSGSSSRLSGVSRDGSANQNSGTSIDQDTGQEDLVRMQHIFEEADEDGGGGLDIDEFKSEIPMTCLFVIGSLYRVLFWVSF